MTADKIVISFDDDELPAGTAGENKENSSSNNKAAIPASHLLNENVSEVKTSVNFINTQIDYFFKANTSLSGFMESDLKFPEGTDRGFNKNYSIDFKDGFFSGILYNNKHIILTSKTSFVYFVERIYSENKITLSFPGSIFEKTGCIKENDVYLNSLDNVYHLRSSDIPSKENIKTLFTVPEKFYIWTNLNIAGDNIAFCIYDSSHEAIVTLINRITGEVIFKFNFQVDKFLSDSVLVCGNKFFVFADNFFLCFEKNSGDELTVRRYELKFYIDPETKYIALKDKLYISDAEGSIYYQDLKSSDFILHYTGIRTPYLNSLAGFRDILFTGYLGGWKAFDSNGVQIFSHNDIEENKIETLNKNILVISRFNKIIFHNLNRFQEAEGFAVSGDSPDNTSIISAAFTSDEILVLTGGGVLESYSNERININV